MAPIVVSAVPISADSPDEVREVSSGLDPADCHSSASRGKDGPDASSVALSDAMPVGE